MKVLLVAVFISSLFAENEAFDCYNCTSRSQSSACTETAPKTSELRKISCQTNCYKWILRTYNEIRRGCKQTGVKPPDSSYSEYTCNQDLCNHAPMTYTSTKFFCFTIISSLLYVL